MIIIPHGLAANVLRALQGGPRDTSAIAESSGRRWRDNFVSWMEVWRACDALREAGCIEHATYSAMWSLRRG